MTTTLLTIKDIEIDISAIESDGARWFGQIVFTCTDLVAAGTWVGERRSEDGRLVDVEGEGEALCECIDGLVDQIEREISAALGRPHDEDPTGLFGALDAVAKARRAA